MKILPKPREYWTFERCALEAKKYKTRREFFKSSAYSPAHKKAGSMIFLAICRLGASQMDIGHCISVS